MGFNRTDYCIIGLGIILIFSLLALSNHLGTINHQKLSSFCSEYGWEGYNSIRVGDYDKILECTRIVNDTILKREFREINGSYYWVKEGSGGGNGNG